jgi:DNA mismatch endonuclease (patch repair protein)
MARDRRVSGPKPSSVVIRKRMESTKRRDTGPELRLRRILHKRGFRYRVDISPVAGLRSRADLVFVRARLAVFIDGCFWHGCPEHATWPKANAAWWRTKLEANRARDRRATEQLEAAGWSVARFWEHESPETVANTIENRLRPKT